MSKQDANTRKVTLQSGETVTVYAIPMTEIMGVVPRPKPKRPMVSMQLATGQTQQRPAKEGEAEFSQYQEELETWEGERVQLQKDVQLVMAFGEDYEYPEPLALPRGVQHLIDAGLRSAPVGEYGLKAAWLRCNVARALQDELDIDLAQQEMTGVPMEAIEEIRANFRDSLRRTGIIRVGEATTEQKPAD